MGDIFNLHEVVKKGSLDEVQSLLKNGGIDINLRDKEGATVLHHAALTSKAEIIVFLLSNGADPSIKKNSGETWDDMCNSTCMKQVERKMNEERKKKTGETSPIEEPLKRKGSKTITFKDPSPREAAPPPIQTPESEILKKLEAREKQREREELERREDDKRKHEIAKHKFEEEKVKFERDRRRHDEEKKRLDDTRRAEAERKLLELQKEEEKKRRRF